MRHLKINNLLALLIIVFLNSCSTDFLEEKTDYSKVNILVYQDEILATAYVDYLYAASQPGETANMTMWSKAAVDNNDLAEKGNPTIFAKATDEVSGEVDINKVWAQISPIQSHCLKSIGKKLSTSPVNSAWYRIRYSNLYLNNVDKYQGLDEDFKNQIKGQLYFWRAWQYFELLRLYGGVPIILDAQGTTVETPSNQTPRSSSSQVVDQIVSDLDQAKNLLENARPYTAADAGRITAAAAAALKGRVLLTWASPLFNRNDDVSRWQRAYDANLAAYNVCLAAGKGLDPDWKNMWFKDNGMESIFSFGFNTYATIEIEGTKNNYTEYASRPKEQDGAGVNAPTKNIMDAFPMADGAPYDPNGNLNHFYKNRDPRFYHTFAYNGSIWPYKENPQYKIWTYYWYPLTAEPGKPKLPTNSPNAISNTSIYLKKFCNDNSSKVNSFRNNGDDHMEIRFAEVVLNLAESAIGVDKLQEGKGYIKSIRARVGVTNGDGDYGLAGVTTRDGLFAACINERKVEFAYENKRFHDLRRWLLYNDDYGYCTKLNQTPIEGSRRQGYYVFAKLNATTILENQKGIDPFKGATAPIINRDATTYPSGVNTYSEYVDYLYDNHFQVEVKDVGIETNDSWKFKWYNEYYFFGIHQDLLDTAPYLQQTQGWGGTFDPLK